MSVITTVYAPRFCPWEVMRNMQYKLWKIQNFLVPQHICWGYRSSGIWRSAMSLGCFPQFEGMYCLCLQSLKMKAWHYIKTLGDT